MVADRYVKTVLTIIAVALVVIAVRSWIPGSLLLEAARPDSALAQGAASAIPKYEVTVPRAWGKFVAFSNNNLLLEGADQSWRIVDVEGKAPEFPKIKALIHWGQ